MCSVITIQGTDCETVTELLHTLDVYGYSEIDLDSILDDEYINYGSTMIPSDACCCVVDPQKLAKQLDFYYNDGSMIFYADEKETGDVDIVVISGN